MGCCSGRPPTTNDTDPQKPPENNFASIRKMQSRTNFASNFISNIQGMKKSSDPDILALEAAKNREDIDFLIQKLDSDKEINEPIQIKHPWAENSRTIGSMACTYITYLFQRNVDEENEDKTSEKIVKFTEQAIESGVIYKIKRNLLSGFQDRIELTILMTLFMIDGNDVFRNHCRAESLILDVLQFLKPESSFEFLNKEGLRIASLQICREIFAKNLEMANIFCNKDGLNYIAELIKIDSDIIIFECVNSLDELSYVDVNSKKRNLKVIIETNSLGIMKSIQEIIIKLEKDLKTHSVIINADVYDQKKNLLVYCKYIAAEFQRIFDKANTKKILN